MDKATKPVSLRDGVNHIFDSYRDEIYAASPNYEEITSYLQHFKDDVLRYIKARNDFSRRE